jgi:hypothetical protein
LKYAEEQGDSRVPQQFVAEDGFGLGAWINNQRNRRESLDVERVRRLEELTGWSWHPREDDWEETYDRLLRFVEREDHARPPQRHVEEGLQLGSWVSVQRQFYRKRILRPERARRLEAVPGWTWEPPMGPRAKADPYASPNRLGVDSSRE